jgi:hypothetical protein
MKNRLEQWQEVREVVRRLHATLDQVERKLGGKPLSPEEEMEQLFGKGWNKAKETKR